MAWIESHQELENHPKVYDLMTLMNWDLDTTIGKLHRFWWWCLKYAEDGDLRKHNDGRIASAMGVATQDAKQLVEAMITSCWIDREPYFRVHDWYDYIGLFLQRKYGQRNPNKWKEIQMLYSNCATSCTAASATNLTNQPNQPNQKSMKTASPALTAAFKKIYDEYDLNIYQLINKVTKDDRGGNEIPEVVLLNVCNKFLKDKPTIQNQWAWFDRVLNAEMDRYNSDQKLKESLENKDPKRLIGAVSEKLKY